MASNSLPLSINVKYSTKMMKNVRQKQYIA